MSKPRSIVVVSSLALLLTAGLACALSVDAGDHGSLDLNENNWTKVLDGEWMVLFYAPWCPACKSLQPEWKEFAKWSKSGSPISVASSDITISPGLTGRFIVTTLPTIFHVKDGMFRYYKSGRDKDSIISFIKEEKWKHIEPISSWKSPNSIQMSVVAQFFKLSQKVRVLHSYLMAEYGLPTWGSYLIFAIATIFIGAILGLLLVCVIDFVYPPSHKLSSAKNWKNEKNDSGQESDDELVTDELIDDRNVNEDIENERSVKSRRKLRKTD